MAVRPHARLPQRTDARRAGLGARWELHLAYAGPSPLVDSGQLLWLAVREPSEDEEAALVEALELGDEQAHRLRESPERASVADDGRHLYVTLVAVGGVAGAPELVPVACVLGPNWVVTAHHREVGVIEEFLERAEGGGQVGGLDAPSFVAAICEWVIASYLRAFEAVESELEELDAKVISETPSRDVPPS